MYKITFSSLLAASIIAGCAAPYSEAPKPVNYKYTEQSRIQAGEHWQIIANDLAASVAKNIDKSKAVYVNKTTDKSDFNEAMHSLLLSSLVSKGLIVVKSETSADVSINMQAQMVKFTEGRAPFRHSVGAPTALTAGVWVLREVALSNSPAVTALVATGALAVGTDLYNWFASKDSAGAIPQNEIIVTVTASDKTRYFSSISNVYYTSDSDESLYDAVSRGKKIIIEGTHQ